jgi:hypothetical protein
MFFALTAGKSVAAGVILLKTDAGHAFGGLKKRE